MGLHTLLYTSVAVQEMNVLGFKDILDVAREFNGKHMITGLLLYHDRTFMQVLEGKKMTIFELYESICRDPRHTHVTLAFDEPIQERMFPDWTMGFRLIQEEETQSLRGYSRFFDEGFRNEDNPTKSVICRQFLLGFRDEENRDMAYS